jgi:hypothetical protein
LIETHVFRAGIIGAPEVEQERIQPQPTREVKDGKTGYAHRKENNIFQPQLIILM